MWNFLIDCVTISVDGLSLDSFISELNKRRINLKNITRKKRTKLRVSIKSNDYKEFVRIADKYNLSYKVIARYGTPYTFFRAVSRPLILIGGIIIISGILLANSFVLSVKYVIDSDEDTKNELIDYCSNMGIVVGAYKRDWNIDDMELDIYLNVDNISYVSIKDTGSTIEVEAVEETQNEVDRSRNEMANVYAVKSCMIQRITLYNGKCLVEVGDVVQKGQLLVSGNVPINNDTGILPMGADADIIGSVYYTASSDKYLYDIIKVRNGEIKKNIAFYFGDTVLFRTRKNLNRYESEYKEYNLFEGILPIKVIVESQFGVDTERIDISLEDAKYIAESEALREARIKLDDKAEIINTSVNLIINDDRVTAQVTIETNELISKRVIRE